jgi:hypothetical protein
MTRLLILNGERIDIDSTTAIGIDFQAYNMSEPGAQRVASSNNFTIPKTANNMRIVGFAGDPQSISTIVYNSLSCEYWIDNKRLIRNGTARVTEVGDRISILAYEKSDIWTNLQDFYWPDFQQEFLIWMQDEKGLPSSTTPYVGSFADFIAQFISNASGITLPLYISNLAGYNPDDGENYIETIAKIYLKYNRTISSVIVDGLGGHFCAYIKTIFEFIESKYGISFGATETFNYNLFNDTYASAFFTPLKNISIQYTGSGYYFLYNDEGEFLPEDSTTDKEDKTLYDLCILFFKRFNTLIDNISAFGDESYRLYRFDSISNAPVIDLSGKLSGTPIFKPTLENLNQNNWIKFSSIYEGGPKLLNSKKIVCNNKNLDAGSSDESLLDIDEYIPGGYKLGGDVALDMSHTETLSNFSLLINSGNASCTVAYMQEGVEESTSVILKVAQIYSLEGEYNTYADMVAYPKYYEVKRLLSLVEIESLRFFARYWIKELNGYFFLQKIEGYNPEKSTEATKIELIKLP